MTWQYAIREHRLVELFTDPDDPEIDGAYAILTWRDIPHILRDIHWVINDIRADRKDASMNRSNVR